MKKSQTSTILTVGFALFAMFFGAGNLIFPPFIGLQSGGDWFWALLGFLLTGIIAPFLGILAILRAGTTLTDLENRINPLLITVLIAITLWLIGPLIAIPRTGATTYEMGFRQIFPSISKLTGNLIFFVITGILAISPSKIVDIIGNYLTPLLIVLLFSLVVIGGISPDFPPVASTKPAGENFLYGFLQGYQTMDVLASVVFAGIIISAVMAKGYQERSERFKITVSAGLVSVFCLFVIYGGLIFLGATSGYATDGEVHRTELLLYISKQVLGPYGVYAIAIAISLACLTTSIALTTAFSEFMEDLTRKKISYKVWVVICCALSTYLALGGVEDIVQYAGPLLGFAYPMVFVIVLTMVFLGKFVTSKLPYILAILTAGVVSALPMLAYYKIGTEGINHFRTFLPLSQYDMEWILPSAIAFVVGFFIRKKYPESDRIQSV